MSSVPPPDPPYDDFWRHLGSPRWVCAPMVEQSEAAFRDCCARHGNVGVCYTPMIHARAFVEDPLYRRAQALPAPGRPEAAPVVAQICVTEDEVAFAAAATRLLRQTTCVAGVDLNLGCPQINARKHGYGAYLSLDAAVAALEGMAALPRADALPVLAKVRVEDTAAATEAKLRRILETGVVAVAVHGRHRGQIQHATGVACWDALRGAVGVVRQWCREGQPPPARRRAVAVIANGNVLSREDGVALREHTGCDAVMSAEGLLWDPALFAFGKGEEAGVAPGLVAPPLFSGRLSAHGTPCGAPSLSAQRRALTVAGWYLESCGRHPPSLYQLRAHARKLLHPFSAAHPLVLLQYTAALPDAADPLIRTVVPGSEVQLGRAVGVLKAALRCFAQLVAEEDAAAEGEEAAAGRVHRLCMVTGGAAGMQIVVDGGDAAGAGAAAAAAAAAEEQAPFCFEELDEGVGRGLRASITAALREAEQARGGAGALEEMLTGRTGESRPPLRSAPKIMEMAVPYYKAECRRRLRLEAAEEEEGSDADEEAAFSLF